MIRIQGFKIIFGYTCKKLNSTCKCFICALNANEFDEFNVQNRCKICFKTFYWPGLHDVRQLTFNVTSPKLKKMTYEGLSKSS